MNESNNSTWDGSGEGWVEQQGGNKMYQNEASVDSAEIVRLHSLIKDTSRKLQELEAVLGRYTDAITEEQEAQLQTYRAEILAYKEELDENMRHAPGWDDASEGKVLH